MDTETGSDGRQNGDPLGTPAPSLAGELLIAVNNLNKSVLGLDKLLRDEYPKRTEIERRFVSKLESKNYTVRLVLVALVTMLACYATSTGAYAACFVGDNNSGFCKYVPGYQERIERIKTLNKRDADQLARIEKLERKLKEK